MVRSALDCELDLLAVNRARLTVSGRQHVGAPRLGADTLRALRQADLDARCYGRLLFEALLPAGSELFEGYRTALALARHERRLLRFRLHLAADLPTEIHALAWELLLDERQNLTFGRSREIAFSRALDVPIGLEDASVERPRLLAAVAAPSDLETYGLSSIGWHATQATLETALQPSAGVIDYEILRGPVTAARLRERLISGEFHLLHLHAHGVLTADGDAAHLVLEDSAGRAVFLNAGQLGEIVEGHRGLRLVTLAACHSGTIRDATGYPGSLLGLGPSLVRRGIPAVLGLRQAVRADVVPGLTGHLYRQLAAGGEIDVAVNETRQQLYLEASECDAWASPILYMRLAVDRLWASAAKLMVEGGRLKSDGAVVRRPAAIHRSSHSHPGDRAGLGISTTEEHFVTEILAALAAHPILLLLAQAEREESAVISELLRRARHSSGRGEVVEIKPPFSPSAGIAEYFAHLGRQCHFAVDARSSVDWEGALDERLERGGRLVLLVRGLERGSAVGRRELAGVLRAMAERYAERLRVVLCGGERLVELKYGEGELSLLNAAEELAWPEVEPDDIIAWQQRSFPGAELPAEAAGELLEICGGQARLVRHCLSLREARPRMTGAALRDSLQTSPWIHQQFRALQRDRQRLCAWLGGDDLGRAAPWIEDPLLRSLFWRNLLVGRNGRLTWRCALLRDIGQEVLGCQG